MAVSFYIKLYEFNLRWSTVHLQPGRVSFVLGSWTIHMIPRPESFISQGKQAIPVLLFQTSFFLNQIATINLMAPESNKKLYSIFAFY